MKLSELLVKNIDDLEDRQGDKTTISGITTGFIRLDQITSGLQNGDIITICGASGSGKRAFAYNIISHAAIKSDAKVNVINFSLTEKDASLRLLCTEARVDNSRIRSGFLSRNDWNKLSNAAIILMDANINFFYITMEALRNECDLILVDTFQRLNKPDLGKNLSQEQISYEIINLLKNHAIEENIPIIVLSSLNDWAIEKRLDKRPRLTDFKYGYSALPDISDVVISIYRDELYNSDENNPNRGIAEISILKQRNGPVGTAILTYLNSYCRYEDLKIEPE